MSTLENLYNMFLDLFSVKTEWIIHPILQIAVAPNKTHLTMGTQATDAAAQQQW